jgi:hypothetical protein
MQDTQRWLVNLAHRVIGHDAPHDLSAVPARELRIVRWYAGFYVVGVAVAVGQVVLLGLPVLVRFMHQAVAGLAGGPAHTAFWDGAGFLAVVAANFGLLAIVLWRDHATRRVPAEAPVPGSRRSSDTVAASLDVMV